MAPTNNEVDRVNGLAILLAHALIRDTNATKASIKVEGASFRGEHLGSFKLTIEMLDSNKVTEAS